MGSRNIAPPIRQLGARLSYPHSSAALPPGQNTSTHCIEGWAEFRAGLDILKKRKICCPFYKSEAFLHSSQLVLVWSFGLFSGHGLPDLLPHTFSVPCCLLPGLSVEQIYVIPPYGILPSTSRLSHRPSSSETSIAFWWVTRIVRLYHACSVVYIQATE